MLTLSKPKENINVYARVWPENNHCIQWHKNVLSKTFDVCPDEAVKQVVTWCQTQPTEIYFYFFYFQSFFFFICSEPVDESSCSVPPAS